MIYGKRSNGGQHGLVLTKAAVVEFMLNRVGYSSNFNLSEKKVLEPASGDGAFAVCIIERLYQSAQKFNFSFQAALENLRFYEIDKDLSEKLICRLTNQLSKFSAYLPKDVIQCSDFLTSKVDAYDLVIGNPPYVRHENIPKDKKEIYRKEFKTFTHRSDLYIAFYEKCLNCLKDEGVLTFICSNRWLKNQYGKNLRELISRNYSLEEIIDLEKTSPFEEGVVAYPAITTITNVKKRGNENYFEIDNLSDLREIERKIKPIKTLNIGNSHQWFSFSYTGEKHERYLESIENQGFKIGIGVATGSDQVFIRKDFESIVEKDLLLPILTSKDVKNNKLQWSGKYILNPFSEDGALINLEKFPKAKIYLDSKKDVLLNRHIAKKNPLNWYKTIDRIKPELSSKNKIILPDISGNTHLLIDEGNFYPHHNLYYITGSDYNKLALLSAILMSDFVKEQLTELGNKMNGGYPRWQSQNLKKLRIPLIDSIPEKIALEIIQAYREKDYKKINNLINPTEISKFSFSKGQTRLFEPEQVYKAKKARHISRI